MISLLSAGEFQALQYAAFALIFLAAIADCLIIDAILHNERLRSGVHLLIMNWAICDLFYLLHVPGFLSGILQMFALVPSEGSYSILRGGSHLGDLLLQLSGALIMFAMMCGAINQDLPSVNSIILYGITFGSMVVNGIICTVDWQWWINGQWMVHKLFLSVCLVTLIGNELNSFWKKCDEDVKPITMKTTLKIDIARIYALNWAFACTIKLCLMSILMFELKPTPLVKSLYLLCSYLTFSTFCTSTFVLLHLLRTHKLFKSNFALNCRKNAPINSINNSEFNEVSSIVYARNPSYEAVHRC